MSKKISIVMAYYNRPQQLRLTLETISLSSLKKDLEVVIVDDGSDEKLRASLVLEKFDLSFNSTYIKREEKTWVNPCHVYNIGFSKVSGQVIIIQNPECFHVGDVCLHAFNHTENNYLVYSCKNIKQLETNEINRMKINSPIFLERINALRKQPSGWYTHPKYNPRKYHFTSSIAKKNLDALGGFDERYAAGYCFDDNELVARVERSPFQLIMIPPDKYFTIHQWHPSLAISKLGNQDPLWKRNSHLFSSVTLKETEWRVN